MKTSPPRFPAFLVSPWFACCSVLALVFAVYCQVLTFHFLPFWDDDTNIHRNPLYAPLSWGSVAMFWEGPFQQLYIPVTYSVWAGLVALSRLCAGTSITFGPINPVFFHAANLTVHLFSTAMVFLILGRLLAAEFTGIACSRGRILFATSVGSLVFALHPVQVEVVSWVSGLRDLLGGGCSLAAVACFLGWLEEDGKKVCPRWVSYAAASLFLLLALGSKPGSVVTPVIALLCGASLLHLRHRPFNRLLWLLPWFVVAVLEVLMTSKAQPAAELARSLVPVWARPLVAGDSLAFYLGKLFWPVDPWGLCADYGRSPNSIFDSGVLFWSWLIPCALGVLLWVARPLRSYLLAYALLVIGVLPTLGLIPFNFQVVSTVSDRYLYLAMLGAALALSMLFCRLPWKVSVPAATLLIAALTAVTLLQLPQWFSGETFFPAILKRNPTSWKSRHNYACTLDAQGKLPEALAEFQEALRLRPSNAEAHNDLGLTLLKIGRRQDAIASFQNSLQVRPTSGAARNLAAVLLLAGEPIKAIQVYRLAMQIDPGDLDSPRALAWLLATHPDAAVRNAPEALLISEKIVQATNAQVPLYLLTLSVSQAESGDFDRAVATAVQAAETYRRSGDPRMAATIESTILPALRNHKTIRDNPAQAR